MHLKRFLCTVLIAAGFLFSVVATAQIPGEDWTRIGLAYSGNITAAAVSPNYDSDQTVYIGVSGMGLWASSDRGVTWAKSPAIPGESTVVDIALAPDYRRDMNKTAFAVTREGHCYRSDSDFLNIYSDGTYGVYESTFTNRTGGAVACSSLEMGGLTAWSGKVYVGTPGGGIFQSITNGAPGTWGRINENTALDDCRALTLNRATTQELFAACNAGTQGPMFKWTGAGVSWASLGPTALAYIEPVTLHSDIGNYSLMWLGTKTRGMWRSVNDGQAWDRACDGSLDTDMPYQVRAIATCPKFSVDSELWEGRSDGMRTSTDGGTNCAGTTPSSPVTAIAFAPGYHVGSGYCDAFVGTEIGLYAFASCGTAPKATGPVAADGQAVAMAHHGAGMFMGSASRGLFKCVDYHGMVQYNSFPNKQVPNITAICLDPLYEETGICGTDATTLFVAANFPSSPGDNGVYKSTDGGNTWAKLTTNWISQTVIVNDLAISPQYRESGPDYTLYAATDKGLLRWDGPSSGWLWILSELPVERVALPPTYDRSNGGGSPTGFPYNTVFIARWSGPDGIFYSFNNGDSFAAMGGECPGSNCVQKVTGFAFPSNFGVGSSPSKRIWVSSGTMGVKVTAGPESWTYWSSLNSGIPTSLDARDIAADPDFVDSGSPVEPTLLCAIATPSPGLSDFGIYQSLNSGGTWTSVKAGSALSLTYEAPIAGEDTMALAGFKPESTTGGSFDGGTCISEDAAYFVPLSNYRSLPDDIYATAPHWRNPAIIFASSPSMGVFVSEDKGESFRPWNKGKGGTEGPCRLTSGYGISMLSDRRGTNLDVIWVGTESSGIEARYTYFDVARGAVDLDHEDTMPYPNGWRDCTIDGGTMSGKWEKIEALPGTGQSYNVWASSTTNGWAELAAGPHWADWTAQGSDPNATSVNHAYDGPQALSSGVPTSGSVVQSGFDYYSIQVPPGSNTLSVAMHPTAGDPDLYVKYGTLPNEPSPWDFRPYLGGLSDESVCAGSSILSEDFSSGIPASWTIVDGGVGGDTASSWNTANPGGRIISSPFSSPFAIVDSDNAGSSSTQDEQLITPVFSTLGFKTVILEFSNQFEYYSGGMVEKADVDVSTDGGTLWTNVLRMEGASDGYPTPNTKVVDISSLASNASSVRIRFHYYSGQYEWYWAIDNVKVRAGATPVLSGTWYLGVRGYATGTSSYSLTATVNGCPADFWASLPAPHQATKPPLHLPERIPDPDAPTANIVWGTVSGTGVNKGTSSTYFSAEPEAITWVACNGASGLSPLVNKNANTVIQLPDLTLIAGCVGDIYLSPDGPCDTRSWYSSTLNVADHGSNNFKDLLLASNGDVLAAASGTGTNTDAGGVWLSGDKGAHWMKISNGFEQTTQKLSDLVADSGTPPSYYSSTAETGLFTRTITASPYPTVTAITPNNGSIAGSTPVTITGTGFSSSCPTGTSSNCPSTNPVVIFGGTEVTGTWISSTQISATTPAHAAGSVLIDVRNPDTRRSYNTTGPLFEFTCNIPSGMSNNTAADIDPCADSGVLVTWSDPSQWGDGGGGGRSFDVLRDGGAIATGLASATHSYTDTTGVNGTGYAYSVRARNSCGLSLTTAGATAADLVTSPPSVDVTPNGTTTACTAANMIFTATATGGTAPYFYQWIQSGSDISGETDSTLTASKGSAGSFTFNCKVSSSGCAATSQDAVAPTGTWVAPPASVDVTPNGATAVQAGVQITWTASVTGGTAPHSYQWTEDGSSIAGATNSTLSRSYGSAQAHAYNCRVSSSGCPTQIQDPTAPTGIWQADPPPECAPGDTPATAQGWSGATTHSWPSAAGATGYRLYRGQMGELANLIGAGADSCTRYDGASTSASGITEDPASLPAGDFFWYLVAAYNSGGEGSAGNASAGARTVNSSGACL